ncbi:hypothetical protein JCM15831A_25800 [Asaia astilbis]
MEQGQGHEQRSGQADAASRNHPAPPTPDPLPGQRHADDGSDPEAEEQEPQPAIVECRMVFDDRNEAGPER